MRNTILYLLIGYCISISLNFYLTVNEYENSKSNRKEIIQDQIEQLEIMEGIISEQEKQIEKWGILVDEKNTEIRKLKQKNQKLKKSIKKIKEYKSFDVTFYDALCNSGCTGITATGVDVRDTEFYKGMRVIATDPSVIPMGSIVEMFIDGEFRTYVAKDTGGAIKGNRIDVLVKNETIANRRGYKENIPVRVIGHIED